LPWKTVAQKCFTGLNILFTFRCFEQLALALKIFTVWNILFRFRTFEQLALTLKNRVVLEFFTALKYILSFRSFEQLALALKNRVALEFFTVLILNILFAFRIFEQLALALKTEGALNSLYWICIFYYSDFWATSACPEKQSCPGIFHCIQYVFFIIQDFWATCACPEKQSCPGILVLALKIFKPGGAVAPQPPASYAYVPDSSTNLTIAISRQWSLSRNVEVECQKQKTYCWLHFLDCAIANLFMILVLSISRRRSCSVLLKIRLFSLFCLMVLLSSFFHLEFRKWLFCSWSQCELSKYANPSHICQKRLQEHYRMACE